MENSKKSIDRAAQGEKDCQKKLSAEGSTYAYPQIKPAPERTNGHRLPPTSAKNQDGRRLRKGESRKKMGEDD